MKKIMLSLFTACLISCCLAADLILAQDGKTKYDVKLKSDASKIEIAAAKDLAALLKEITGADFAEAPIKTQHIFVGVPAPGDTKVLQKDERRRVTENGNIYLYGQGKRGNVNAVYDFLKDDLHCRFFTPELTVLKLNQKDLVLPELNKSLIPSIPIITISKARDTAMHTKFARRMNLLDRADDAIGSFDTHAGQQLIPSGEIPFGGHRGNIRGPFKYFKDKKYMKTNPEFFAKNEKGQRCINLQLCYSNMKLRDEIEKNIEYMLKCENYTGGRAYVGLGQDDNGGKFCYCNKCEALEAKYKHPAGAYYDFLLDMGRRFEKKYPDLRLTFLAYRSNQTLRPSPIFTKLPSNLMPSYAPLGCDFCCPLTDPRNKKEFDCFAAWAKLASEMHWWAYPTPYPRPIICYPLIANLHRLAENFRLAYKNNVKVAYCEFGSGAYFNIGFNDLRTYLICELCRNINADEMAIKQEFCQAAYGPAAEGMLKYIAELEKLEPTQPYYFRWNPDQRILVYTTPDNMRRWENNFDQLDKIPGLSKLQKLNLARARFSLDETVVAKFPYMSKADKQKFSDLETIIARAEKTLAEDSKARFPGNQGRIADTIRHRSSGLRQFIAAARGGKALPAKLAGKPCYRVMPDKNKKALDKDPAAPFGLCNAGAMPKRDGNWLAFTSRRNRSEMVSTNFTRPLTLKRIAKEGSLTDGKYHYYALGTITLEQICWIGFSPVYPQSSFYLGHLFDPEKPNRSYEVYVAIACNRAKKEMRMGEVVLIPSGKTAPAGKNNKRKQMKNDFDVFS